MSNLNKIKFRVVHFTSEDPDYPASQLNEVHPTTKGWQSVRFCTFPQEIGFQMVEGEVRITQIQVLSHQSKIASKVEIFVGKGPSYAAATFKRLGYLSLDSNERSNYQARELKTVFVDNVGNYLKLMLYENHMNKVNSCNQVGIVALSLVGADEPDESKSSSARGDAKAVYKNPYYDLTVDINLDPQTASKLRQLAEAKARAIANEDYSTAKQIKVVEQELKSLGSRLAQLDMAKAEAVAAEDYDLAKEIKDECDGLRIEIERKIRAIDIPGARESSPAPPRRQARPASVEDLSLDAKATAPQSRGEYVPFDELPVGGKNSMAQISPRGEMGRLESFNSGGKRAVSVEPVEHPGFESKSPPLKAKAPLGIASEPLPVGPDGDRAIRPMNQGGMGMGMDDGEEDGGLSGGVAGTGMPVERFPPGEHPLEGVPGFLALPTPEMLTSKGREFCETNGVTKLLGEYRARCLFSKSWNLREACMTKTQKLLESEIGADPSSFSAGLLGLCGVLRLGAEDKIQQVLFSSLALMEAVLREAKLNKVGRGTVAPAMEAIIVQLVDKLADGNARLREGARKGIDLLTGSPAVGPHPVAVQLVKPLPAKQKTGWRPLTTRLQVLTDLVNAHGLGSAAGLQTDMLLNFPKAAQAYAHSNKEVRDAAKDLVVAIHAHVGSGPLEPTLALLRKNQREEYEAAFEANSKGPGGNASKHAQPKGGADDSPPRRTDKQHQHAPQNPGGKVPTSSHKVQQTKEGYPHSPRQTKHAADEGDSDAQDFTSCMFCGVQNRAWTENDLDLHYWKDCPLLIACPSCSQIVEIAGLPEHLLDECEAKDSYVPCDVTGLAIRKSEFEDWRRSPKCVPAPNNFMHCPLCLSTVEDSDDAWMTHLDKQCPKNVRIQPS